jgi:hypothetical protein
MALHHEQVEFIATGLEVQRLGAGTALAEKLSEIEAPGGAGEFERAGEFRGRPTAGTE